MNRGSGRFGTPAAWLLVAVTVIQAIVLLFLKLPATSVPLSPTSSSLGSIPGHKLYAPARRDREEASDDELAHGTALARRQCIQDALYREMGWREHREYRWLPGCHHRPLQLGLVSWAQLHSGCDRAAVQARPRASHPIRLHVTVHRWVNEWQQCLATFLSSWRATQPGNTSTLTVWVVTGAILNKRNSSTSSNHSERQKDLSLTSDVSQIIRSTMGRHRGEIQVQDVTCMARLRAATPTATCVTEAMWDPPAPNDASRAQTRAQLLRLAALHTYGGVWFDLCTVLGEAVAPLLDYVDEFGVLRAASPYYTTAAIALRRGSPAARAMLHLVCRYPKSEDRAVWGPYCNEAGQPCPLAGWYSHAPLAWAFRRRFGVAVLPAAFFDPVAECECGTAGAPIQPMAVMGIGGAVDRNEGRGSQTASVKGFSLTDALGAAMAAADKRRAAEPHKCPPSDLYIPRSPCWRYRVSPLVAPGACLAIDATAHRRGALRGGLTLSVVCARAALDRNEKAAWLYCPGSAVRALRSSFNGVDGVACVDSGDGSFSGRTPLFTPCLPTRQQQNWSMAPGTGTIRAGDGTCMTASKGTACQRSSCWTVEIKPCNSTDRSQMWSISTVNYFGKDRLLVDAINNATIGQDV